MKCVGDMDDKEVGSNFGNFKLVDEVVRFYIQTASPKLKRQGRPRTRLLLAYKENLEQGKIYEPWHISKLCVQEWDPQI